MKKRLLCGALVVCLLICCFSTSCAPRNRKDKYTTNSFDYFDTVSIITGYAKSQKDFDKVAEEILSQLAEYHKLYSIYHRYEDIENLCTVNELVNGAHRTVKVDRRIIDLLLFAKEMYTETDGMVNVAMGSVLSLWHDYRTVGKDNPNDASLPRVDELTKAAKHTNIEKLIIDEENCTVTLLDHDMKLDVGAVAKGYATEQIAQYLEKKGISGYVLNIGGNVRTVGPKYDGTDWTVGVENPDGNGYLAYLELSGMSVVTSGSYQRYYVVDGKKYHHIINPDTQMPAEGYLSVSVVCKDSGLADALSTALFCMPFDKGFALVEKMQGVEAMWLTDNGEKHVSSGWMTYEKN